MEVMSDGLGVSHRRREVRNPGALEDLKLGLRNDAELTRFALQNRIIEP
jgi:hypothetical protein